MNVCDKRRALLNEIARRCRAGRFDSARALLDQEVRRDGASAAIRVALAEQHLVAGDLASAFRVVAQGLVDQPANAHLIAFLASVQLAVGQPAEAQTLLESSPHPKTELWKGLLLASAHMGIGDHPRAAALLRAVVKEHGAIEPVLALLLRTLERMGDWQASLDVARQMLALGTSDREVLVVLSRAEMAAGRPGRVVTALKESAAIQDPTLAALRCAAFEMLGDVEASSRHWRWVCAGIPRCFASEQSARRFIDTVKQLP
ncbi:MAG: hypothetical protein A2289_20575 [Deltaproteobacteria bacterium RIFOXYA12_FULL_58_15]|nr:MAG: hypothetical protein A2289_20575 [Deltaproteobacteria bacterium RIFOXYA12_FULL_58_15]OGR10173.1 MAG: hypothetical protein A2341_06055 [Deltaproteobacteria bacterium RIFOXYB12_FULL_58_9]